MRNQFACHELIKRTAVDLARELYSACARNNEWYKQNRDEMLFVARQWPRLLHEARHTLAGMLATSIDENLKEQIADALVKDNDIRRGRKAQLIRP